MHLKMVFAKSLTFCLSHNVLKPHNLNVALGYFIIMTITGFYMSMVIPFEPWI